MEKDFVNNTDESFVEDGKAKEEKFIDSFKDDKDEIVDLTSDKLNEMNKKLPEWSIEPPHSFLNK